jgi:hypothetical protein
VIPSTRSRSGARSARPSAGGCPCPPISSGGGDWPRGAQFNNAAVASFGTSYNLGAGVRSGGFYELDNNLFNDDDFGGFIAYQFLPFAELNVNAGKHEFVNVRLMISYALERP